METPQKDYSDKEIFDQFGPIEHYNVLLFDYIIAERADCEGAMALAGNAQFGSSHDGYYKFDIGGANKHMPGWEYTYIGLYENPKQYPSLLMGGEIQPKSTSAKVFEGPIVFKESYQETFSKGPFKFEHGTIKYVSDDMIAAFFEKAYSQITCTSNKLFNSSNKQITAYQLRYFREINLDNYLVPDLYKGLRVAVLNYKSPPNNIATIPEMYFDKAILKYDLIVINIDAKTIKIPPSAIMFEGIKVPLVPRNEPENKIIQDLSGRIVFNCPNAETIELKQYALYASLIAPKAHIVGTGGSINGMVIANTLHQIGGFEPHAFMIPLGPKFWIPCDFTIKIVKRDKNNTAKKLSGAIFNLFKYDEDTQTYRLLTQGLSTDEDGSFTITNLKEGKYKLVETTAPWGYTLASPPETLFQIPTQN